MAILQAEISTCKVTGSYHNRLAQSCEDCILVNQAAGFCFCGIADGKSGAPFCIDGGQAALNAAMEYIQHKGIRQMSVYPFADEFPAELMHAIRSQLLYLPQSDHFEDYASTLLAAAIDPETGCGVLIHLGDGCAVGIGQDGKPHLLSKPDNSIDTRFTWLTTSQNAAYHLRFGFFRADSLNRILLMSDGATALCNGKNISPQSAALLAEGSPEQIQEALIQSTPRDDATCILLQIL